MLRLLAKRNKQLGGARTRSACRLHALLVELVPGGISKEITVNRAQRLLDRVVPTDPVACTRSDLALEHLEDLRRIDEQLRALHRRMAEAVRASRTSVTELFGFGPVGTAIALGYTRDVRRFADAHRFAAYNGTAPIEVSSGGRLTHRLSRRGNRQLNHAIHMAAITQIRHPHSPGYGYYQRKLAEGKTKKEAIRGVEASHQRRALHATRRRRRREHGPGRASGDDRTSQRDRPRTPRPALEMSHSRTRNQRRTRSAATTRSPGPRTRKPARSRT